MRLSGLARKRAYLSFAIVVLVSMGLISPNRVVSAAQSASADLSSYGSIRIPVTWTITASAGSGGSIDPDGDVVVNEGADQTFTITADPRYEIADVVVDGGSVGAVSEYTFTAVDADHTIAASFSLHPGGIIWGANLYVPAGSASTYLDNRVFQAAQEMGLTHLLLWQRNYNEHARTISTAQMVDAVSRMRNYNLQPIISLEYDVDRAVELVTALGSNCMMYTVGKEPHVSGTDATATVNEYISYWNQIVTACRQVNPNAMYGGPCVGSPTTSTESRSGVYVNAWLQQCDGDFLVVHSFPGGSTQSTCISRAHSYTVQDMEELRQKLVTYGKPNMPIVFGEIQYTGAQETNGWDYDQDFMDQWTDAFMSTAESEGLYGVFFWVLIGYDNNYAILRPPSRNYERKPQFYSIQSYI